MRTGKFIFILFLFCSLIAQAAGVQTVSLCESDSSGIYLKSSSLNEKINIFDFFHEVFCEDIEEAEGLELDNDRKVRKPSCKKLFFTGQPQFSCSIKYKRQKNAYKVEKYSTSHLKYIMLLL